MIDRRQPRAAFAVCALVAFAAAARPAAQADPAANADANAIECWSRTSTGAVHVGEAFSLALTCAVAETDSLKVILDQAGLDPLALRVAPFEVLGGTTATDLKNGVTRFFQYTYRLRLIADDAFGRDVKVPEITVSFRLQRRVGGDTSIEGRDHQYILPAQSIRVLSLVPSDAPDIRDGASAMFGDLDERSFRASVLLVIAGVLFTLGGVATLVLFARLIWRDRPRAPEASRQAADSLVLRGMGRELDEVRRERQQAGWTPDLVGRALAALRVVGAYALDRRISVSRNAPAGGGIDGAGALLLQGGWFDPTRLVVSSPLTSQTVVQALAGARDTASSPERIDVLEQLERALARFTQAQYGGTGTLDQDGLDDSLTFGVGLQRRLKFERTGLMKKYRAVADLVGGLGTRVWSR